MDIEDGNFVSNITFGLKTIRALREITYLPFSFHLMVTRQLEFLGEVASLKPSIVFGHFEALPYPGEFVGLAKEKGAKCGFAFNPATPVEPVAYLMGDIDGILLMSSEPDRMGECFIANVYEKIKAIRGISKSIPIWIDGGVTREHLDKLREAGATNAVMGRAFFA